MVQLSDRALAAERLRRLSQDLDDGLEVENLSAARLLEAAAAILDDWQDRDSPLSVAHPDWEFLVQLLEAALHYE